MGQQTIDYVMVESSELGETFKCNECGGNFSVRVGERIDDKYRDHITETNLLALDQ